MKTIAIAGASGFIGKHLIQELLENTNYTIVALSRSKKKSTNPRLKWVQCDLFSLLDIESALRNVDIAYYLVHSMQPSANLDQAQFNDYDLILADNFGRGCKKLSIEQIIYLGGIIPQHEKLSLHLQSREEIERALKNYIQNYTFFRAGMVLGARGSSFQIMASLLESLPVLICPSWTHNSISPVDIDEVTKSLVEVIDRKGHLRKIYDLVSSNQVTYLDLLQLTSVYLNLKRKFIQLNVSLIGFSKFWVSFFSGAPRRLVYPLLESLRHQMVGSENQIFRPQSFQPKTVEESLKKAVEEAKTIKFRFYQRPVKRKTVRSVQRMPHPGISSAREVALEYMFWLPRALFPLMIVKVERNYCHFSLITSKLKLLTLQYSPERSTEDRQIFYIKGGLLAASQDRGRLEFREVLNKSYILAAIHDFYPALPWYIYRYTQAVVHLIVMNLFARHLGLIKKGKRKWIQKS